MEKIKLKQKSRPSALDTPALPVCQEQLTLGNKLESIPFFFFFLLFVSECNKHIYLLMFKLHIGTTVEQFNLIRDY